MAGEMPHYGTLLHDFVVLYDSDENRVGFGEEWVSGFVAGSVNGGRDAGEVVVDHHRVDMGKVFI